MHFFRLSCLAEHSLRCDGVGGEEEWVLLVVPDASDSRHVRVVVGAAVVGHVAVVVVSEVAVAAGGDVAQVGGAALRLVVAVDLAGHDGGLGAGVALSQGLTRAKRKKNKKIKRCQIHCA